MKEDRAADDTQGEECAEDNGLRQQQENRCSQFGDSRADATLGLQP